MQQEEKIFADGFSFKRSENAPDFVVGRLSLKVEDAIAFIREHDKRGWINLNIKTARSGNHYVELDTYEPKGDSKATESKPTSKATTKKKAVAVDDEEVLPF
jgi:hypothetical protein